MKKRNGESIGLKGASYGTKDSAAYERFNGGYTVVQRPAHGSYDFLFAPTIVKAREMCDAWQAWRDETRETELARS